MNRANMENVNYYKQLIDLSENINYSFNFSFGLIRIFQSKKNWGKEM